MRDYEKADSHIIWLALAVVLTAPLCDGVLVRTILIVQVRSYTGKGSQAEIVVLTYSMVKRVIRTAGTFFGWIAVALLSLAVPIVHFVLVPTFLVIALWHSMLRMRTKAMVSEGWGTCPECGARFTISAKPLQAPFVETCDGCQRELEVRIGD